MTADDINRQRKFLDDSSRYGKGRSSRSMSMTTKACHGCGDSRGGNREERYPQYWERPTDRVCNSCRQLLYEALNLQEKRASESEHKLYFVERRTYYEGRHPHKSGWIHDSPPEEWMDRLQAGILDPSSVMERVMGELAESLAADLPTEGVGSTDIVYPPPERGLTPSGRELWLRPEHAFLLRVLDAAIRQSLIDRSDAGEEHGRNLLGQLATGELSVQKFNDLTLNPRK